MQMLMFEAVSEACLVYEWGLGEVVQYMGGIHQLYCCHCLVLLMMIDSIVVSKDTDCTDAVPEAGCGDY